MSAPIKLRADDRVLLLALPVAAELLDMASALSEGLLVGLASGGEINEARQTVADFENTMFAPADPDGVIPWKDRFFTVIVAPHLDAVSAEMERVLAPGGTAYLASSSYRKLHDGPAAR